MGQAASLGLTQQDVEEVIAYCQGAWKQEEIEGMYKRFRSLDRGRKGYISGDEFMSIPELSINPIASRLVSPPCASPALHGAGISMAQIPCLADISAAERALASRAPPSPRSQVRIYESVNFKEFVKLLSAFSARGSRDVRLEYMFRVYDVDGDGEHDDG